jgi:hypothetical protein
LLQPISFDHQDRSKSRKVKSLTLAFGVNVTMANLCALQISKLKNTKHIQNIKLQYRSNENYKTYSKYKLQ